MKSSPYKMLIAAMAMSLILTGCQFGKKDKKPKDEGQPKEEMSEEASLEEGKSASEKDSYFDRLYSHIWEQAKKAKEGPKDSEDNDGEDARKKDEEGNDKEPLPDDPEAAKRMDQSEKSGENSEEDKSQENSEDKDDLSMDDLDQALSGLLDEKESADENEPMDEEGFAQVNIGENDERKDLMIAGKDGKTQKRTIHFIHIDKSVDEEETTELVLTEGRKDVELYYYTNGQDNTDLRHFATAKLVPSSMSFNVVKPGDLEKKEAAEVFQKKIPKLLSAVKHYLTQSDLSMSLEDLHFGTDENSQENN